MINNIIILSLLPILTIVGFLVYVNWNRPSVKWLITLTNSIIWFLPFEVLPSLTIGGARLKINYIIITITSIIFLNLLIRRKILFRPIKLSLLPIFITLFSLISFANVINYIEFGISFLGLTFCALATFFISNYADNLKLQLQRLILILVGVSLFGLFQFVGDMVGLSQSITFLRDNYTKEIFGIPRIHGTVNEPQLFAGILFLPIIYYVVKIFKSNSNLELFNKKSNWFYFSLLIMAFILTISKGATIVLFLTMVLLIIYLSSVKKLILKNVGICLILSVGIFFVFLSNQRIIDILYPIVQNISETILGISPSSGERGLFLYQATRLIGENKFLGIGLGQFGSNIGSKDLIVNNVYYEIWLETGLLNLFLFLFFNILLFKKLFHTIDKNSWSLIFTLCLVLYLLQWLFFSPIFITPIFIMYGIMINHTNKLIK